MREFLRTGEFGPLRLGDSVDKMRSIFGEPHAVSRTSRRQRSPGIWKYGDIEFHLTEDGQHIWLIFCDSFKALHLGSAASLDAWFFAGHPSCEEVERELASEKISSHRHDMRHEPTGYVLRLESGVELLFSRGTDPIIWPGRPGLFGFQFSRTPS